ncbi:uncharacterized protein LOC127263194 [Andrographis paniculata]|uniref:uncharacterized protein LOC127263194 n=1 Tax=Andrographis paniculata TaxID=175694 RepID=UPI0021E839E8|nr:uncharacterized protein LOC127263194 [Andrographis paniculata]
MGRSLCFDTIHKWNQVQEMAETSHNMGHPAAVYGGETTAEIRRKWRCSCIAAFVGINVVILLILICIVSELKVPTIRVRKMKNLDKIGFLDSHTNLTLIAILSVKNPNNFVSFKYGNTTSLLFYHGEVIGEARGPPGRASARRTTQMGVRVEIMTSRIVSQPWFYKDMGLGVVVIGIYSRIGGRVEIFVVKKYVVVKMNCMVVVNVTSRKVQSHKCTYKVKL